MSSKVIANIVVAAGTAMIAAISGLALKSVYDWGYADGQIDLGEKIVGLLDNMANELIENRKDETESCEE